MLAFTTSLWVNHCEHGDIITVRVANKRLYLVARPRHVRHILLDASHKYDKGRTFEVLRKYLQTKCFASHTEYQDTQKLFQASLSRRNLRDCLSAITRNAGEMMKRLAITQGHRRINVSSETKAYSIITMLGLLAGRPVPISNVQRWIDDIHNVGSFAGDRCIGLYDIPLWIPTPASILYQRSRARLVDSMEQIVREVKRSPVDHPGMIRSFSEHQDTSLDLRTRHVQLIMESLIMVQFACDALANPTNWLWYHVAKDDSLQQRLREEILRVVGDAPLELESLRHMDLLRATVDEIYRMYPPYTLIGRDVVEEDELDGVKIEKGAVMLINQYVAFRLPEYFPSPEKFHPERFLGGAGPQCPFEFYPFNYGRRSCAGQHLVDGFIKAPLVAALRSGRLSLVPGQRIRESCRRLLGTSKDVLVDLLPA